MSKFSKADKEMMVYLVKKNQRSYKYVADRYGTTPENVKDIVWTMVAGKTKEEMIKETIVEESEKPNKIEVFENKVPVVYDTNWHDDIQTITFGLMGDTQINSKYTQLTHLHNFYDICASRGITTVYHTGDIDEGEQMRMGHQYECYTQGVDDHVAEIVKNYPRREGITTYFITGNHDASITRRCGCNIGKMIANERDDMIYLGQDRARINITPKCTLELRHPWDGTTYALSYKPQKMVESFDSDDKPNILAIGHYHKIEQLYRRGVHVFQTGAFQSATPFTLGKGIAVDMGGWIITIKVDREGKLLSLTSELVVYDKAIKDDYKNWR